MPDSLPPNRSEEYGASRYAGLSSGLATLTGQTLNKPESYFRVQSGTLAFTTGTQTPTSLAMPVFWQPGQALTIMLEFDAASSGVTSGLAVNITGSPWGSLTSFMQIVTLGTTTRTYVTDPSDSANTSIRATAAYSGIPTTVGDFNGGPSSGDADTYTLQPTFQRYGGSDTILEGNGIFRVMVW